MRVKLILAVVFVLFVSLTQNICYAQMQGYNLANSKIPKEPGWKSASYRGWELFSLPGLISTYYDLNLDGTLDYMVIRKILRKMSADKVSIGEAVESAKFDNLALYISKPVIYFTSKFPLFYCIDLDYRKNCNNMWVDVQEDGLNDNETYYTNSKTIPSLQ